MTLANARFPLRMVVLATLSLPASALAHNGVGSWFTFAEDLAGTTWIASDTTGPVVYHFEPDGTLQYQYPDGRTFRNGTWSQMGSTLHMEINQKYSERSATILGRRIIGEGWNRDGRRWLWDAYQQKPARAD